MIKAYEIQGVLALENAFNRVGLDHVILVRVATRGRGHAPCWAASREQIVNALSNAWIDGGSPAHLPARARTPGRASPGPPATPPAAACGWRCMALRARWAIPPR